MEQGRNVGIPAHQTDAEAVFLQPTSKWGRLKLWLGGTKLDGVMTFASSAEISENAVEAVSVDTSLLKAYREGTAVVKLQVMHAAVIHQLSQLTAQKNEYENRLSPSLAALLQMHAANFEMKQGMDILDELLASFQEIRATIEGLQARVQGLLAEQRHLESEIEAAEAAITAMEQESRRLLEEWTVATQRELKPSLYRERVLPGHEVASKDRVNLGHAHAKLARQQQELLDRINEYVPKMSEVREEQAQMRDRVAAIVDILDTIRVFDCDEVLKMTGETMLRSQEYNVHLTKIVRAIGQATSGLMTLRGLQKEAPGPVVVVEGTQHNVGGIGPVLELMASKTQEA